MKPIRILLADDHTIVRAGIRSLLEKTAEFQVVAEAADGREALDFAKVRSPDVVLMDIGMSGLNGLDATVRLLKVLPAVQVIILSMHANDEYVAQARRAGASGYLLKRAAVSELEAAIKAVFRGETYFSPSLAGRVTQGSCQSPQDPESPLEKLTPRQREILQLIAESKNTKEIALLLGLSPKTIEFHRAELMNRLGIHDVPGLVRYAMQRGLSPAES